MSGSDDLINLCTWQEVRCQVEQLSPELFSIIEKINPSNDYKLIEVTYPFGSKIIDRGHLFLPDGRSIKGCPFDDPSIHPSIQQALSYSAIPLALILEYSNEVFVDVGDRSVPLNIFNPGDLFGLFETMNQLVNLGPSAPPLWSVTAGARSVFMLPKISEMQGHNRIRRAFNIGLKAPDHLMDHWKIFKEIAFSTPVKKPWANKILFFSREWIVEKQQNAVWMEFYTYLFRISWQQLQLLRDGLVFNLAWGHFTEVIGRRNFKPRPYIVDTVKHLISLANSSGIGFVPAVDESCLPLELIQSAYNSVYGLKYYVPTVMQPQKISPTSSLIYYSLSSPTVIESSPATKNTPSLMEDQREIKHLLTVLHQVIGQDNQDIYNPIQHANFEFFHSSPDPYQEIKNSEEIPKLDSRFLISSCVQGHENNRFCATAPFMRGCISIHKNDHY